VLVVVVVVVILFAVFMPPVSRHPIRSKQIFCCNSLKEVSLAFRIFANDHADRFPVVVSTNDGGSREFLDVPNSVFRHFQVMSNELSTPKILVCPADERMIAPNFTGLGNSNISYFLSLDAQDSFPRAMLAGDRNLMASGIPVGSGLLELTTNMTVDWTAQIHRGVGNAAFGDGSVEQLTGAQLQREVGDSGLVTNRLLIP
jgi:prepilin-type processing-associated H-X9-DG protein